MSGIGIKIKYLLDSSMDVLNVIKFNGSEKYHLFDDLYRSACFENKKIEEINSLMSIRNNKDIELFIYSQHEPLCETCIDYVYNNELKFSNYLRSCYNKNY